MFPFTFGGVEHTKCTMDQSVNGLAWCATEVNETTGETLSGRTCGEQRAGSVRGDTVERAAKAFSSGQLRIAPFLFFFVSRSGAALFQACVSHAGTPLPQHEKLGCRQAWVYLGR